MKCIDKTNNRGALISGLLTALLVWTIAESVRADGTYTVWSSCGSGTSGNVTNIVYGGGVCVGICSDKTVISSPDGTSWSTAYTATDVPSDLVYSGGKFYGCAGSNFLTSADGTVWTSATFHGPNPNYAYTINAITYGTGGEMVAGGYSAILCSSDYGITWVPLYLGAMQANFVKFSYLPAKDQFVGLGSGGVIVKISKTVDDSGRVLFSYQPYGSTQTMYFTGLNCNPYSGTFYGIIVDNIHDYWISASTDLNTWNHIDSGKGDITGFAFYNGMGFGMGLINGNLPAIDTAGAWSHQNLNLTSVTINDIAYGDSTYIAVGNNGVILSSTNGTSWTACSSGTTKNLFKVIFVNASGTAKRLGKTTSARGAFIAVGAGGTILTTSHVTSLKNNRLFEHPPAGRGAPTHAYSIDGRVLKASLQKRSSRSPSGLVVWH